MNKILSKFIVFLSFIIFFAFVSILVWGVIRSGNISSNLIVNKQMDEIKLDNILAKDFELFDLNGNAIKLSDYKGKLILLDFWSTWCPPCRTEAQLLESAWRVYGPLEVMFVGVNIQDDELDGVAYLAEFEITYPNGRDVHGNITVDYGVIGLPVTFFVGRDGIVKRRWVGSISETELGDTIDELLTGYVDANDLDGENLDQFFKLQKVLDK